jgi:hypothetical protein
MKHTHSRQERRSCAGDAAGYEAAIGLRRRRSILIYIDITFQRSLLNLV